MKKYVGCVAAAMLMVGCSPKSNDKNVSSSDVQGETVPVVRVLDSQPLGMVLKATAFKMSGDYADKVAVTLDNNGNLVYYPAPTDLSSESVPTAIGDGWYLNRQGLGDGSVFTKWTFAEYRAMKTAPTPDEIKKAIIPGATVTEFRQLPISASKAREEAPANLLKYLQ